MRVVGEAEVVVATNHDQRFAADLTLRTLASFQWNEVGVDALGLKLLGTIESITLFEDVQF